MKLTTTLPRLTMLTTLIIAPSKLRLQKYATSARHINTLIRGIHHLHSKREP